MLVERRDVPVPFTEEEKKGAFVPIEEARIRRNWDKFKK